MITIIVLLLIGSISLLAIGWLYASDAPAGYEDETGFHFAQRLSQPQNEENTAFSFVPHFRWSLGFAAAFVGFLILIPETNHNAVERNPFAHVVNANTDSSAEKLEQTTATTTARLEHSRLMGGLCLRFTEVQ